ncbi:dual specificity protein kinase shkE-like [Trichogramma pretiosum]|uniref:dual specificity protein kinase shkE-like n=1 Tax=Trichogramma pretiosum TaxID=7493 RepID=UPI0006C9A1AB|nr:dual specificity protein kinase shkE-like [Trichogramma pretiosum]
MEAIKSQETPAQEKDQKRKKIPAKPSPVTSAAPIPATQYKKINVQWHHRPENQDIFYKQAGPPQTIEVDPSTVYSVQDIITKCVKVFKNNFTAQYFERGEIKLGKKNFEIVENFGTGGFWQYYKVARNLAHRPPPLYLYTYLEKPVNTSSKPSQIISKENCSWQCNDLPNCKSLFKTPLKSIVNIDAPKSGLKKDSSLFKFPSQRKRPLDSEKFTEENQKNMKIDEKIKEFKMEIIVPISQVPIDSLKFTDILLGKGAFGEVKKAFWGMSEVTIKTIDTQQVRPKDIIKELVILRQVVHTNIVNLMGYSTGDYEFHIIMEFIDGYTLRDLIFKSTTKSKFPLNESDKLQLAHQIFLGISFLHEFPNPVIHRDIKPANIMITKNKLVKICDLGVSSIKKMCTQLMTAKGHINCAGTPMYMAPEIYLYHQEATTFSDKWSLGCTIVELFSERHVWHTNNYSTCNLTELLKLKKEPNLSSIPAVLRDNIKSCFSYDRPSDRPTAEQFVRVFRNSNVELQCH